MSYDVPSGENGQPLAKAPSFPLLSRYGPGASEPSSGVQQAKKIKVLPTAVNGTAVNGAASSAAVVKLRPTDNGLALQKVGTLHLPNRKPNELQLDVNAPQPEVANRAEEETRSPTPDYDVQRRPSRSRSKSRGKTKTPTAPSTPKSSVGRGDGPPSKSGSGRGKLRLFKTKSDAKSESSHSRVRARSLEYLRADVADETQERRHSSREDLSGDDSLLAIARSGPITVFSSQKKLNTTDDDWEEMPSLRRHQTAPNTPADGHPKQQFYFGMTPGDVAVTTGIKGSSPATGETIDLDEESRRVMEEFDAVLAENKSTKSVDDKSEAEEVTARRGPVRPQEADEEDQDIALNLRPTLPKKPQQLPRFSPSAAWRALGHIQHPVDAYFRPAKLNASSSKASDMSAMDLSEEDEDDDVMEDRIAKNALRPVAPHQPRISNEKSADSGISGDAGSPDAGAMAKPLAMSSPVPHQQNSWTPQQDLLDDESNSSSTEADQPDGRREAPPPKIIPKSQMFNDSVTDAGSRSSSVSKGRKYRKRHEATSDDHGPQKYNSLRKLKRSVSGAFASAFRRSKSTDDEEDEENVPVDNGNWVLSRSAPNSIVNGSVDDGHRSKFRSEADLLGYDPSCAPQLLQQYPAQSQPSVFNQRIVYLPQYDTRRAQQQARGRPMDQSEIIRRAKSADAVFHEAKAQHQSAAQRLFGGQQKKFTFQSTVRLHEKRMLEERLSREAETKERKRIQEVQAMQRVEEEFQRKRAREKANIRQQLRVLQLDSSDDRSARMDPEGAPSSLSSSHRRTSSDELHHQKQQQQHLAYRAVAQHSAMIRQSDSRIAKPKEPVVNSVIQSDFRRQVIHQSRLRSAAPPSPSTAAAALEARVNAERIVSQKNNNVHKKSTSNIYKRLAEIASEEESIASPPPVPVLVSSARSAKPQQRPTSSNGNNNVVNSNGKVMMQELSEYRQERREYRDVRSPRTYQQQQQMAAPTGN